MIPSSLVETFALAISSKSSKIILVLISLICYITCLIVYRLYLSPLSKVPGPKLAAATSLYAFYYDVICKGRYVWEVEAMHKQYGPLVRIRPEVLHCNDPDFIDSVFGTAGKRRDKYKIFTNGTASPGSIVSTLSHELHRSRRAAVNPFFSQASIRRVEPIIDAACEKVLGILVRYKETQKVIILNDLFRAMTSDIIAEYCFGHSNEYMDAENLKEEHWKVKRESAQEYHVVSFMPFMVSIMKMVPQAIMLKVMPGVKVFILELDSIEKSINLARQQHEKGQEEDTPTVFRGFLNSKLSPAEKETQRLLEESYIILEAGTHTTADTLTAIIYHILHKPDVLNKLRRELLSAFPDPAVKFTAAEAASLPYLSAIVEEGLRLNPGASVRQERVAPDEELLYEDKDGKYKYTIPRGTPVGMTAPLLGRNAEIYPSPSVFRPERFIENPRLDRYSITFSRGVRRCLGMNLAYQEMYLLLATVFRKYGVYQPEKGENGQDGPTLELWETDRTDVDMDSDHVSPHVKKGSVGVRLKVRS